MVFEVIENGNAMAMLNLGIMYHKLGKEDRQCYMEMIKINNIDAMNNLALLYKNRKNMMKRNRCILKYWEMGDKTRLLQLGNFSESKNDLEKAKKYYLEGVKMMMNIR